VEGDLQSVRDYAWRLERRQLEDMRQILVLGIDLAERDQRIAELEAQILERAA
jgi:hypothetical protein